MAQVKKNTKRNVAIIVWPALFMGATIAHAADNNIYDYDDRVYKDRAYINKTLSELEKHKKGEHQAKKDTFEQYAEYDDAPAYDPDLNVEEDLVDGEPYDEGPYDKGSLKDLPPEQAEKGYIPEKDEYYSGRSQYGDKGFIPDKSRDSVKTYNHGHNHNKNCEKDNHAQHDRFSHKRGYEDHVEYQCIHPGKLRRQLTRDGWHNFKSLGEGPYRIRMIATSHDGRQFRMVLNRCTGEIIRLRPMHRFWGWRQRERNFY